MSFSSDVKNELLAQKNSDACCNSAELSAILHTAGSINISHEGLCAEISTDNVRFAGRILFLFKKLFNINAQIVSQKKSTLDKRLFYKILACPDAEQILSELGIISLDKDNHRQIAQGIDKYITEQNCCKKSYLKGAFLAGGSITVPSEKESGYNLSLYFSGGKMAEDIAKLLEHFNIKAKTAQRKNSYVVYLKEGNLIADFLALLKASKSFIALQEIMLEKEVINNTNRQTNCIFANIDKSIKAAIKQVEAINLIESTSGLDSLPPPLIKIARLRQEYPDVPLEKIAALSGENLTKSGVNHRMRKIMETAEKIQAKNNGADNI